MIRSGEWFAREGSLRNGEKGGKEKKKKNVEKGRFLDILSWSGD